MKKHLDVHFSSARQDWATPPQFIQWLSRRWGVEFDLDVAASDMSAKAPKWFTINDDALTQEWSGTCWMNPPFGRALEQFIDKAIIELKSGRAEEVWILVPARTETKWFHDKVMPNASNVFLIRGRFCFIAGEGKTAAKGANSPFPSCLIRMCSESVGREIAVIEVLDVPRYIRGFKTNEIREQMDLTEF
jgi:phage N-6-adenine-methyltransferase